jgi:hypothetical protein
LFDDSSYVAAARFWALHDTNFYKKNGITAEYAQGSRKWWSWMQKVDVFGSRIRRDEGQDEEPTYGQLQPAMEG